MYQESARWDARAQGVIAWTNLERKKTSHAEPRAMLARPLPGEEVAILSRGPRSVVQHLQDDPGCVVVESTTTTSSSTKTTMSTTTVDHPVQVQPLPTARCILPVVGVAAARVGDYGEIN